VGMLGPSKKKGRRSLMLQNMTCQTSIGGCQIVFLFYFLFFKRGCQRVDLHKSLIEIILFI
jgi:hypothetical protein